MPNYIQVASQLEFSRLVCALERFPRLSFLHKYKNKKVFSVQMDLLKENPIIYYIPTEHNGKYLCYGFNGSEEESSIVNNISDTSHLYSPIIHIKSLPDSLLVETNDNIKYQLIELEDLSSLAKLSYSFEDSPLPLFLFPYNYKWLMGLFVNFNEDGISYFCYVLLNKNPEKPYLQYSTTDNIEPVFVDNIVKHGYLYIKIIRLKEAHPLVNYG